MALLTIADLLVQETKDAIYAKGLAVAQALKLPVRSWQSGDPTRSLYWFLAEILEELEAVAIEYLSAGFLDFAVARAESTGNSDWLVLLAKQVFNVDAREATYAAATCTLSNALGGLYVIEAGDLTAKSTTSGKTFHNTTGGTLASGPGTTLDLEFEADESGSDSSASAGEIDTLVTTLNGVTIMNALAAVGVDQEEPADLAARCRAKWGSLSPNGPADAYNYVALSSDLTGTTEVTRSRTIPDSITGTVVVYIAGAAGLVTTGARDLVEAALVEWALPACITLDLLRASNSTVAVTYQLWIYSSVGQTSAEIEAAIETALQDLFRTRPIGGDIIPPSSVGKLYRTLIESTIRAVFPGHAFRVAVTVPSGDTTLSIDQVAVLGTITPTITLVDPP